AFKFCYPGFFIQRRNSFGDQLIVGHRKSGVGEPGDTTNNNHNKDQEATSEQPVNNIFIILVCHVKFLLSTYYFSWTKPKEMPLLIINSFAASYSLGISPSRMASLMASFIIPISREGCRLNVSMISSPLTGGWKFLIWSFSSTSLIFFLTFLKLLCYFLNRFGFLVVISASHRIIRSSMRSPASKTNLLTAESVTFSSAITIGRLLIRTSFCTYFIFSLSGMRSCLKSL